MAVYRPGVNNSIDEAMIPFKGIKTRFITFHRPDNISFFSGRSSIMQYLPKKMVKCGFKVCAMADSSNGYFLDLQIYIGRVCWEC